MSRPSRDQRPGRRTLQPPPGYTQRGRMRRVRRRDTPPHTEPGGTQAGASMRASQHVAAICRRSGRRETNRTRPPPPHASERSPPPRRGPGTEEGQARHHDRSPDGHRHGDQHHQGTALRPAWSLQEARLLRDHGVSKEMLGNAFFRSRAPLYHSSQNARGDMAPGDSSPNPAPCPPSKLMERAPAACRRVRTRHQTSMPLSDPAMSPTSHPPPPRPTRIVMSHLVGLPSRRLLSSLHLSSGGLVPSAPFPPAARRCSRRGPW